MTTILIISGLAALVGGAELLVRGASRLAARFRVPPLVVGLTVVAFGTSAPEMAASLAAALAGRPELALANAVGSNIFNVLGILGAAAVAVPLTAAVRVVRVDVPVVLAASVVVAMLAADGTIGRWDGWLLLGLIVVHTVWTVRAARRGGDADGEARPTSDGGRTALVEPIVSVVAGLLALIVGARWLVAGAVVAASSLGISERIIGLTVVSIGTSLPELATSLVAALRGEKDIAVGNVVGSNLFNLTAVVGLAAIGSRSGIPVAGPALTVDIPVMIATAAICLPVFFTGFVITRWEGAGLLAALACYLGWVILGALDRRVPTAIAIPVLAVGCAALATTVVESLRQLWRRGPEL